MNNYKISTFWIFIIGICFGVGGWMFGFADKALALTGEEIIRKVDANMTFTTARTESRLVIHIGNEVREKEMINYEKGRDTGYAEFLSPPRDKGVKYLKIADNMWMYLPSVEKIIKIEGHMLRQSMMGSDFSYEDALESTKLLEKYAAQVVTEETISVSFQKGEEQVTKQRPCYVIDLIAKVKDITYYKRRIWVDKEVFIPLMEELFALSGKKLKVMTMGDIKKIKGRFYPMYYTMKNLLRSDSLTEMFVTKAEFDIEVPPDTFTQRNLK